MSNPKSAFVAALQETPDSIKNFLEVQIPDFQDISWPTDSDAAIIANGQLAYNVNLLLKQFSGLTLIELLLRIGQHNPVTQGILLSCLEYLPGSQTSKVLFVAPQVGGIYYGWFSEWQVRIQGDEKPSKVTCLINGEEFDLSPGAETGVYEASWPVAIGEWQATATATFATHTGEALAGFSIRHWADAPTTPEEGGRYTLDQLSKLRLDAGNSANAVKTVTASSENTSVSLVKAATETYFLAALGDLAAEWESMLAGAVSGRLVWLLFEIYESDTFQAQFRREFYIELSSST
jgi:hypothetical protein